MSNQKASDRDVSRAIRSWLHEDRHEDVSRIAGAVLDQVDAVPQRRAMTLQTPRSFNSWLRGQLKEKKMSQRQLALQSGVDHSTISRLIKGDRMSGTTRVTRREASRKTRSMG